MYFVQYYHKEKCYKGETFAMAMGDRAVVILDGRNNINTMYQDAVEFNGYRRPKYDAFAIFKGETFSRSERITEIFETPGSEVLSK